MARTETAATETLSPPFREALCALCEISGLSQAALADLVKADPSTVNRYARGKRVPDAGMLHKLSAAFALHTDQSYDVLLLRLTKAAAVTELAQAA